MQHQLDCHALRRWFVSEKRTLPWRGTPSPYAVWVSEIMLQQTQVSVVLPYFERWMRLFPTIEALATASEEAVLKAWEGLGYYSRARNLQTGAQWVVDQHQGNLPSNEAALTAIKGIGPYTAGAIRSFAFHQKAAAVDGNVLRVLARYFHIDADISLSKTMKTIHQLASAILPDDEPWVIVEALIELGAVICGKKAKCKICPLKGSCLSYRHGDVERIPFKSKKTQIQKIFRSVAIITTDTRHIFVKRVESGQIMSGLHEFPYFESGPSGLSQAALERRIQEEFGLGVTFCRNLEPVKHSFTRYHATLFPIQFHCTNIGQLATDHWLSQEELKRTAFSSGHRRILQNFSSNQSNTT